MSTSLPAKRHRKPQPPADSTGNSVQHHLRKKDALQILRAVAALLVVYAHSIDVVEAQAHAAPRQIRFFFLENFGACGVDIFFAISGFILSTAVLRLSPAAPRKALDFIMRRYIRILPIYWIVTLIPLALSVKRHQLGPQLLFSSIFLLPSFTYPMLEPLLSIGWTLIFEMFFYYVLALNLLFGVRRVIERVILTISVFVVIGLTVGMHHPLLILVANPINIEFLMGCIIALVFARLGHRSALGTALLILGAAALGSTIFFGYREADHSGLVLSGVSSWYRVAYWGIPAAILTAGIVFRPGEVRSAFGRFCVYLGDASYSIYLTSVITLMIYGRLYRFVASVPADLNIFIGVALVTIVGAVTYSRIEKPITQFVSGVYRRHGAPPVRTAAW